MKKTMLKSTKSFIIAVAVCAGLALGVFSSTGSSNTLPTVAAPPSLVDLF